jgi:UDP-2,4-diacetamido-2,4,6-trideoxy-beta-L-altropyranose hydrolase
MASPLIAIRTVCGGNTGYGHLTRCLSLAHALEAQGAKTVFLLNEADQVSKTKVAGVGAELVQLPDNSSLSKDLQFLQGYLQQNKAAAVVLDGYQFDQTYLDELSSKACCLYIDDLKNLRPSSALVLSQNPGDAKSDFKIQTGSALLLGLQYALIAPSFLSARKEHPREVPENCSKLLISFGGSDPNHLCAKALQGLASCCQRYEIKVVAGGGLHDSLAATRRAADASHHRVEVLEWVDDMPGLMNWANMALCGSGVTSYEMCCLGLPMVVITPVDNQIPVSRGLQDKELIHHLGWWEGVPGEMMAKAVDDLALDSAERTRLAEAGQKAVDGKGAERVARKLLDRAKSWQA